MNQNERRMREITSRLTRNTLTPSPWHFTHDGGVKRGHVTVFVGRGQNDRAGMSDVDAEFAAHARDDVPWLVARVKQLEAALEQVDPRQVRLALALDPLDEE